MILLMTPMFSILFMFFSSPLSKGYMLLLLTISTSLSSSLMYLNAWFGYILFLVMVGGMLVAFIYMTSVASNEKFMFPSISMMSITVLLMTMTIILVYMFNLTNDYSFYSTMNNSQEMMTPKLSLFTNKIFSWPLLQLPIALMSYLFLTLIMVVKMTDFSKGPIRQK
uniref:NADH-ubiquinone oxidoreductase chain 6 n=1 Tax=Xylosandrus crassiusculus TaxID=124033 RepID=A0A343A6A3_9CUCU|nr:NADH dehydrogenase subunit 6 [Xylosandrus crassiusculus]AOY40082.1 NADH dehydrogenase subunit 6 [Xylosandrus crassiusculus]